MTIENCSYDRTLEIFLDIDESKFTGDEPPLSPVTIGRIQLIAAIFKRNIHEILDDLAKISQENEELQIQENELQYGHIDMYGDDKKPAK